MGCSMLGACLGASIGTAFIPVVGTAIGGILCWVFEGIGGVLEDLVGKLF